MFLTPTLPIHYDTFVGLRWKIRGVNFTLENPNVKCEIKQKFCLKFDNYCWSFLEGLGVMGYKKYQCYCEKAHLCVNPRRLSHLASKLVRECDLQVGLGKFRKSHTLIIRKSPIGNPIWWIESSRDPWRHVTLKGQGRDPNMFRAQYLENGWR